MKTKILTTLFTLCLIFGFWFEGGWFVGGWFTLREETLMLKLYDPNGSHQDMYGYTEFYYPDGSLVDPTTDIVE